MIGDRRMRNDLSSVPLAPPEAVRASTPINPAFFTLTSADGVAYTFRLTPHMWTHSLYLQAAKEVGATVGFVPVGSAQAVRDYAAYLQYVEFSMQLSEELAKGNAPDEHNRVHHQSTGVSLTTASLSAGVRNQVHATSDQVSNHGAVGTRQQRRRQGSGARSAMNDEWLSPFQCEEYILRSWLIDGAEGELELNCNKGDGPVGYEVQPLDCDRAYAQHANELLALRDETAPADRGDANGEGGGVRRPGEEGRGLAATGAASGAANSNAADEAAVNFQVDATDMRRRRPLTPAPSLSSSRSSSATSSTSVSEASLAAYRADAQRGIPRRPGLRFLGREPGYSAQLALEDCEGVLFLERVLLPYAWRDRGAAAGANRGTSADTPAQACTPKGDAAAVPRLPSSTPEGVLTAPQQRRLLELIAVADFLGTQSLVELCAKYLAAWLMDHTDEAIVQSFLVETGGDGSTLTGASASKTELTGTALFQDPWLRRSTTSLKPEGTPAEVLSSSAPQRTRTPSHRESKSSKKNNASLQQKTTERGKRNEGAGVKADEGAAGDAEGGPPAMEAVLASDASQHSPLLSGDQRLSVVRQLKRSGAIMTSPY
ncbi:hypothetical protein ABL78_1366 [Leptomonas seymouri]|uniref:Uncharacterized protein n=1 Tax=Leptomonas seymouri TaxID=5684 RepID=A0A0N1I2A9_LEPSE|nr:hypothetical protein ABL78_1366 [Leptomonas seymouri]|eukprot:KPI89490.1 hypothetical protein ABL78_1366 [Leptomonas seymouri]